MKYYVVSDIHGYFYPFVTALKNKGFFEDKSPNKLIICGDLLDRGYETNEVCQFFVDLIKQDRVVLIRGNHEDLIEDLVDNLSDYIEDITSTHHYINCTYHTLMDLTQMNDDEIYCNTKKAMLKAKNSILFKQILPKTVDYFETEKYIFVHGWIPCKRDSNGRVITGELIENWRENSTAKDWYFARWINGMDACNLGGKVDGKTVVCGHKRASYGHYTYEKKGAEKGKDADNTPYISDGIIALDGNTAFSGLVNCVVIED